MFQGNVRKIATVLTASDQASSKLDSAEKAGDDVADSMEQAEQRTDALTSAFTRSAAATAALAGTMGLLTRQHGETEQTFSRLQVVAGATNEEMRELQSTAMQMGVDLPIAMGDAAEAMEQLAFAGFEAQEAVSAANGVANLAVASGMNMSQSARTAASTLRMFNMEAEETHQVTSTMAAVFSNSATTIDELSSALEMTGSTAAAAGIEMQEVAAAVGVLADQGIRASRAGTALNTTLQRITTGSGQAEQALSDLGLSTEDFVDEAGEIEDLETMLNTIGAEMEELETDVDRLAVATELAGQRGARALLPLLENTDELNQKMGDIMRSEIRESIGEINRLTDEELAEVENVLDMDVDREDFTPRELVEGLEEMNQEGADTEEMAQRLVAGLHMSEEAAVALTEDVEDASVSTDDLAESIGDATTASEIAAAEMSTTAGMVEFARSSFDAMTFTIFTGAAPAITWFNERLAQAINVLNNNETAMRVVGGTLAVLTGALGLATLAIGSMIVQLKLATFWSNAYLTSTTAGTVAMKGWTAAAIAKNKALWLMTASTGRLVAALSAKTGALWASVSGMLASTKAAFTLAGAKGILSTAAFGAAGGVMALWTALGPIGLLALAITGIILGLAAVMKFDLFDAGDQAAAALGWLTDAGRTTIAILRELGGIAWELGRILVAALTLGATEAVSALTDPNRWRSAGRQVVELISNGLAAFGPAKYALPILGPLLLARDIITDPQRWFEAGQGIISTITDGIQDMASSPIDAVTSIADGIRSVLPFSDAEEGPLSDITQSGVGLIQALITGMSQEESTVREKLATILGGTPLGDDSGSLSTALELGPGGDDRSGSSTSPIILTLEQTINLNGDMMDPEEIREIVREAARDGGSDALKELELILKQATSL